MVDLISIHKSNPFRVGIVVPAFNERDNLIRLIEDLKKFTESLSAQFPFHFVVVFVDDGSIDGTFSYFSSIFEKKSTYSFANASRVQFEVLRLPVNLGIGKAVQTGFYFLLKEKVRIIVQMDGDGQHPPSELSALLAPLIRGDADISIGSRYLPDHRTNVSSLLREMGTRYFSKLIFFLTGRKIYDVTSGYRAFSREVLEHLVDDYPDDFPEVQAYVVIHRQQCAGIQPILKICEVPVKMRRREFGSSSITSLKIIYYIFKVTLASILEKFRSSLPRYRLRAGSITGLFFGLLTTWLYLGLVNKAVGAALALSDGDPHSPSGPISSGVLNAFESLNFLSWKAVPGNRLRIEVWAIAGCVALGVFLLELVRRRKIQERYSLLWFLTLGVILTLTLKREWLSTLATTLGIHYPPTALLLTFVFFLMAILIHFSMVISHLLSDKQKLAQEIGLLELQLRKQQREVDALSKNAAPDKGKAVNHG